MHLKKIKKLLKKINNLHQSFLDDDTISNIERDLFLSYVKELYEAGLDDQNDIVKDVNSISLPVETKKIKSSTKSKKKTAPKVKEAPTVAVVDTQRTNEIIEVLASTNKIVAETPPAVVMEKIEPIIPVKEVEVVTEEVEKKSSEQFDFDIRSLDDNGIPVEMEGLFEPIEVKELSAKLANAPIKNIKSKLSINEKLLTIKELFNGDQDHFNQAIDKLDSFSDFEQAKTFLAAEVVNQFAWLKADKYKKAVRFVQLIQRRYL